MADATGADLGLVVPIDVVAFCVGTGDAETTGRFAGPTVDYGRFADPGGMALLGGDVTRGFQDTSSPLEPGVHIHWALPDALTRASGADLAFPAVPDRWLVTRIVVDGSTLTPTSYLVESDTISEAPPDTSSIAIPVKPTPGAAAAVPPVVIGYLGRSYPLDHGPSVPDARSLVEATGASLTAVANGLPSFAAYYPEARGSFGFHDQLDGVASPATLTYVVTGWFDDLAHDPARLVHLGGDPSRTLADTHQWRCVGDETYTLYSGSVQHVTWSSTGTFLPSSAPTIDAGAAVADTPFEALSAWFAHEVGALDGSLTEDLLTSFQLGLWGTLSQPAAPLLGPMRERLHASRFRAGPSGPVHRLQPAHAADGGTATSQELPTPLAEALDALNAAAADLVQVQNQVDALRWQVYADWYRYFAATSDGSTAAKDQAAIFNHATQTLMPRWDGALDGGLARAQRAVDAATSRLTTLLASRRDLELVAGPGPRYHRPTDPVVLLCSPDLVPPSRYGGDASSGPDGLLASRGVDELVTAVDVTGPHTASDLGATTALDGHRLPYADHCSALIAEALLLDVDLAASWSGVPWPSLRRSLDALLDDEPDGGWRITAGTCPSPVAIAVWEENPWLPLFLTWEVSFVPVHPTATGTTRSDYPTDVVTSNFTIDPRAEGFTSYTPATGARVDPTTAGTDGRYRDGWTLLSDRAAEGLARRIATDPAGGTDPVLTRIATALDTPQLVVQPLAGLTDRLVHRRAIVQASIVHPPDMTGDAAIITDAASDVLATTGGSTTYDVTPAFGEPFNPLRAGWLDLSTLELVAVDAFGQRRPVNVTATQVSSALTATSSAGVAEPGFAFTPPRLAQGSRLLFQWCAASDGTTTEWNGHPAQSPIIGWVQPDHLNGGFDLFDAAGRPLGSLFPAGDDTAGVQTIVWQGAPGNDRDVGHALLGDPVLATVHPQLRELVVHLGTVCTVADFRAFYAAVDAATANISPANLATDAALTVLRGRPVALAAAALTLDLDGPPLLDQADVCLEATDGGDLRWVDSDAGIATVTFPVQLGDLDDLDDGLVGFFASRPSGGFDLGTFYSAATDASRGQVVAPAPDTLLLSPTPAAPTTTPTQASPLQVLLLIDPRAPVHATSGILPTRSLLVPPDLASAALGMLELSFPVSPVLRARGGMAVPTVSEAGFEVAYLEQREAKLSRRWDTVPLVPTTVAGSLSSSTPQSLTEGWLRLTPAMLDIELLDAQGRPVAQSGQAQPLTLRISNRRSTPVTFLPATGDGGAGDELVGGSTVQLRFGTLVADADVARIAASGAGWSFALAQDPVDGPSLVARRTSALTLQPARSGAAGDGTDHVDLRLGDVTVAGGPSQAFVSLDYVDVDGTVDGVATATVTLTPIAGRP